MEKIKRELSNIIPKELSMNIDFKCDIINMINIYGLDAYKMISPQFIKYISNKFDYNFDDINSIEIRKYILGIAIQIKGDGKLIDLFKSTNSLYPVGSPVFSEPQKVYTRKSIKDRKKLLKETPIAQFDEF